MTILKRLLFALFVLCACVGCDQSTKWLAEAKLPGAASVSFASDTLRLQVAHNEGAFLSLGADLPKAWRLAALRIGVSAMLLGLLAYILVVKRDEGVILLSLMLVLAGGTSNLIDRFVHSGYVVDFINVGIGPVRTGIFNVADVAIMTGAFLLFVFSWRKRKSAA